MLHVRSTLIAILLIAVPALSQAAEGGKPAIAAGEIAAFEGGKLTLKLADGSTVDFAVPDDARVTGLKQVDFSELKTGDYIATAAFLESDGSLRAREVRIFPPPLRGVAEGHFPYPGGEGSTMTNATIEAIVGDVSGRTFKVAYKGGGEKTVTVPDDVPVMRMVPGNRDMLKPGAHITVFAVETPDGLKAVRFGVGLDGLEPPV